MIDYSQADFSKLSWFTGLRWRQAEFRRQEDLKFWQVTLQKSLLLLPHVESRAELQQQIQVCYREICQNLYPDMLLAENQQRTAIRQALRTAWEEQFGDLADPETQRKIEDTAAALRKQRTEQNNAGPGRNPV